MNKSFIKRPVCFLLALVMLLGIMPAAGFAAEETTGFAGKTLSILGDSISTYKDWSNGAAAQTTNSTIASGAIYYPRTGFSVTAGDTWWHQAAEELGMELLVNNSWSGSCLLNTRSGAPGAYRDRCVQLHDDTGDNAGQKPDIIAIFLGTNDYYTYSGTLGSYEAINFDALISESGEGFTYAEPATSTEAYAIILHKIAIAYPDAEVYCFTMLPRLNSTSQPTAFNDDICQLAAHFGANIVDLYNCGISPETDAFNMMMGDSLHPDCSGMDAITNAFVSALLKNSGAQTHDVSFELTDTVALEGTARTVLSGGELTVTLSPLDASRPLEVSVVMGGEDITESCYANGSITIPAVTDDVYITAEPGVREPLSFRWETRGDALVSIDTNGNTANELTQTHGTISGTNYSKARFTMSQGISLRHDLPWRVEWKSSGTWTDSTDGALLFSQFSSSSAANGCYFYRRHKNDFFALGTCTGGQYHNYGVSFAGTGIDTTAEHTFRLENRIRDDGSNMVYLFVDNVEVGPLNHHWVGGTDKKETVDWVSGKDFSFSYMGTTPHTIGGCSIEYIQVWENYHTHTYENGTCTGCGAAHPKLEVFENKVIAVLGDSISTFAGYIPVADGFNLEHLARYPQDDLVTEVQETWWMQVINGLGAKLGINDSWRGATCSGAAPVTSGTTGENAAMSNLTRIENLSSNGTPDVILFYGGTNDLAHVSKVGTFDPNTAPTSVDLTTKKWDNLADGYVNTLLRLKHFYPEAQILCLLPTYTASYYSDEKLAQGNAVLAAICQHYGVPYVDLRDCGITAADLPDGIHPGEHGMDLISAAVIEALLEDCRLEPGEHTVHPVTHTLSGAVSSKTHIKGISHGKPFTAAITGKNLTVTVTMDGVDITDTCYADGIISIGSVTGELHITASGDVKGEHEDHLTVLPETICSSSNLWNLLERSREYYTATGWGVHSSGKVFSVTIPVTPGQRIYATSFGAAGSNGSNMNGIRVTWFGPEKMLNSVGADKVYAEFAEHGYLTVPEGAVAVCIPMWTPDDSNALYLLGLDHIYENGACTGCGAAQPGVVILTQPVSDDAAIGEKATIFVEAQGEGLRYQWYYRDAGDTAFTKSTVRKSTYTLTVKASNAARELYCVITDSKGNQAVTDTVKLLKPLAQELKILRQPESASAAIGETATVSMEVQGVGLSYQWYYRDLPGGSLTKSTITSKNYSLTVKPINVNRELYCVITDSLGNQVRTETVKLVLPLEETLELVKQPVSSHAAIGETASVSVEARGEGLRYQWYFRNTPDGALSKSSITGSTYCVTVSKSNAQRVVYCVITDGHGNQVTTDTVALRTDEVLPVYYTSLADALAKTNGRTSPEGAVALVNEATITLLQDTALTAPLSVTGDISLELNGFAVSAELFPMFCVESGTCTIRNGSISLSSDGTGTEKAPAVAITVASGATLEMENTVVTVLDAANGTVNGILTESGSMLTLTGTDVTVTTGKSLGNIGVYANGEAVLRDCSVIAEADYTGASGKYTSYSKGIVAKASLELYDCYVWGAHCGFTAYDRVYVNGGTYEGYGHGAFYLCGSGVTSYLCNAAFNWAKMRKGTTADSVAGTNNSACYIGGGSNATAYFDNCSFKGNNSASKSYGLVLRSSGGEANNTAFVSNSTFKSYNKYAYRIGSTDKDTNIRVYSGVGNTFSGRTFNYTSRGISTEESYAQIIADNTFYAR